MRVRRSVWPFGLSIVVPAIAGPFYLGNVVVRAWIYIDPHTAQVLVASDQLPHILDGIPTDIRTIDVTVNRPGFTFNPTSCDPMEITGTIIGAEGAGAAVSSPFQVANCAGDGCWRAEPKFTASTQGKTSKADGASLKVKVEPPAEGPQNAISESSGEGGSGDANQTKSEEANIRSVKVELPKQLPSRLTTLQKACTAQQFNSNPAGCPSASMVGTAIVHTPILPVPLEGPAIFVSHGNEAFPSLTMVLQGDGVTIDLVGTTFISKAGITSTTFKSVPDAPFTSFELTLPEGPYSALAANANLCTVKGGLKMPTEFVAQNGAVIRQSTPIGVDGCAPAITVVSHKVKGRTATIAVQVPAAGKLVASGRGLARASKKASKASTLTLKLHASKSGKFSTKIKLTFTPKSGKRLSKTVTVHFAK